VTNSASPSASATPTKADKEPPNPDNFFWVTYKVGVPKSDLLPKVSAIKAAKAVCRLFEGGWTMDNFGAEGYPKDDSNVWHIGSAVQAYCPKFKDALLD
jgi:hypothetical protein